MDEKLDKKAKSEKETNKVDGNSNVAWWKDLASKKDQDLSFKEKLFKIDYQAYQAFGYLRAWKALKGVGK